MDNLRASNGLIVSFISSGMGNIDYCLTETGQGSNDSIRLTINNTDKTHGRFIANKKIIPAEGVIIAFNEYKDAKRAEFLTWAERNNVNPDEYPDSPRLETVRVI